MSLTDTPNSHLAFHRQATTLRTKDFEVISHHRVNFWDVPDKPNNKTLLDIIAPSELVDQHRQTKQKASPSFTSPTQLYQPTDEDMSLGYDDQQ